MTLPLWAAAHPLVHVNAALNALATLLLVVGLLQIKRGDERRHGRVMAAAFAVSTAFLICYLTYHAIAGSVKFTHPGSIRYLYWTILATHIVLAATVPFLAVASIWYGLKALGWRTTPADDKTWYRRRHRRVVRWAYPIWMYVSITGVAVYVMLYHLWPPEGL